MDLSDVATGRESDGDRGRGDVFGEFRDGEDIVGIEGKEGFEGFGVDSYVDDVSRFVGKRHGVGSLEIPLEALDGQSELRRGGSFGKKAPGLEEQCETVAINCGRVLVRERQLELDRLSVRR